LPISIIYLLYLFIFWRFIGVVLFIYYKNTQFLVLFYDIIKEFLLLYYINSFSYTNLIIISIAKILFEYKKNGTKINYID
jgi:hypothetical protein